MIIVAKTILSLIFGCMDSHWKLALLQDSQHFLVFAKPKTITKIISYYKPPVFLFYTFENGHILP